MQRRTRFSVPFKGVFRSGVLQSIGQDVKVFHIWCTMVDSPEDRYLRHLSAIDGKLDHVVAELGEMKTRVGRLEKGVAEFKSR